jgi:hypothetical protein
MNPPPAPARRFTARLADQADPEIGREVIRVSHDDGRTEELFLHDYERLYSLPGVYEEIVQDRLRCRSPQEVAALLASAVDALGWDRAEIRAIDLAAGNGVSGEALAAEGLRAVLGTDIVPSARDAALRDRPELYGAYLTLDLLQLTDEQRDAVAALNANALNCVAPVGSEAGQLPAQVLVEAAKLLAADSLVAYMHDPTFGTPDVVTAQLWADGLGAGVRAQKLVRRRYVHRYTVNGAPYEMEASVWRLTR